MSKAMRPCPLCHGAGELPGEQIPLCARCGRPLSMVVHHGAVGLLCEHCAALPPEERHPWPLPVEEPS